MDENGWYNKLALISIKRHNSLRLAMVDNNPSEAFWWSLKQLLYVSTWHLFSLHPFFRRTMISSHPWTDIHHPLSSLFTIITILEQQPSPHHSTIGPPQPSPLHPLQRALRWSAAQRWQPHSAADAGLVRSLRGVGEETRRQTASRARRGMLPQRNRCGRQRGLWWWAMI